MKPIKLSIKSVVLIISLAINIFSAFYLRNAKSPETIQAEAELLAQADTLSEWDIFTLALMKVESDYDNTAVSTVGAKGYFQITPIYVREVNRIHKTNYTFDQVTDFNTAWTIFDLMQKAHNPNYNMDKALELHNGNHDWYKRRVYNEMKRIRQYENMRNKLKSI